MGSGGRIKTEEERKHPIRTLFKKIKEFILGAPRYSSNTIGSTSAYDPEKARIEETLRINNALEEFRTLVSEKADEFESNAIRECWDQIDELMDFLHEINDKDYNGEKLHINLSAMERDNREIVDEIHGSIKKDILSKVNLDNLECKQILAMEAGSQKKKAMNEFMIDSIRKSMKILASRIKKSLNKNCNNIEDRISARLADITNTLEVKTAEFDEFSKLANGDKNEHEKKQIQISAKIAEYSMWLNLLDLTKDEDY